MADGPCQSGWRKKRSKKTRRPLLYAKLMAKRRNIPSVSGGVRMERRRTWSTSTTSPRLTSSHVAPYRQRHRYESTLCMRSVDPNRQAGPLCPREHYRPSAHALVSLQRDQGKGVPQIPLQLRTRQHNTLDPTVQQHLACLSFNWQQHFPSSSSSTWTDSSTWWSSPHWDHQWQEWQTEEWRDKKVVEQMVRTGTATDSCSD